MAEKEKSRLITVSCQVAPVVDRAKLTLSASGPVEELDEVLEALLAAGAAMRGNTLAGKVVTGDFTAWKEALHKDDESREKVPRRTLDPAELLKERERQRAEGTPVAEELHITQREAPLDEASRRRLER